MSLQDITGIFGGRKGNIIGNYKKNAVMILILEENGEENIVFEVRAQTMRHQPGDICLPGGKIEEGESALEAAVRETKEELNLNEGDFEVIGEMDYFVSPYGSIMYPFVARLFNKEFTPNSSEVDHIFKVPLSYLYENEPLCYRMNIGPYLEDDFPYHLVRGGREYKFSRGTVNQYFYKYKNYVIWGFTAMVVKSFIDIVKQQKDSN